MVHILGTMAHNPSGRRGRRSWVGRLVCVVAAMILLAVPALPVASAATPTLTVSQDQAYVVSVYQDFLGRSPNADEMASALTLPLATPLARALLAYKLESSAEFIGLTVEGLYSAAFGRVGDSGGVAYWTRRIMSHRATPAEVAVSLYSSPEAIARFGASNDRAWMLNLYLKVLGRDGNLDPSGVNYWVSQLATVGHLRVAEALYQSSESRQVQVDRLYQTLLDRSPEAAAVAFWSRLIGTSGAFAVAVDLSSSVEYLEDAVKRYGNGTAPPAPTGVTATPGDGTATVSWDAPGWDGGSPITAYTVTSSPGGQQCMTTSALTCTVTGLPSDTTSTFVVTATSAIGTSAASVPSAPISPTLLGWSPPPGAIPASGTVFYFDSDPGAFVGEGENGRFTLADSAIDVRSSGNTMLVGIFGDTTWDMMESGPAGGSRLTTGYWPHLNISNFNFGGDTHGCNDDPAVDVDDVKLQVDDVAYDSSGTLQRYQARFVQHCQGETEEVRGFIRYDATDPTTPTPPGNPADFTWQPPAGAVPATGDFVYFTGAAATDNKAVLIGSDPGFVLNNNTGSGPVGFSIMERNLTLDLYLSMDGQYSQSRLAPGLYSDVEGAGGGENPAKGGFSLVWQDVACDQTVSTVALDKVTYDASGGVASVAGRFVQKCVVPQEPPTYGAFRIG